MYTIILKVFHFKVLHNAVDFQIKRNPYLRIFRIMGPIGGINRLFYLIPVIALFIGTGLSCKSALFGPSCTPRHNTMKSRAHILQTWIRNRKLSGHTFPFSVSSKFLLI